VLTQGANGAPLLDNGRGSARASVHSHPHELKSGRTSSISRTMLGYDGAGRVLNYAGVAAGLTPAEISAAAARVLHFIDLGGSRRFLKTFCYGACKGRGLETRDLVTQERGGWGCWAASLALMPSPVHLPHLPPRTLTPGPLDPQLLTQV